MTDFHVLAVASVLVGLALLVWGFGATRYREPDAVAPHAAFDVPTTGALSTPTVVVPAEATRTATPEPFAGEVVGFLIPRFDVDAQIENIGLIPGQNQLDVTKDPHKVGWYGIYDRPGWMGDAGFSAHIDYWPNIRGAFFNLSKLAVIRAEAQQLEFELSLSPVERDNAAVASPLSTSPSAVSS